MISHITTEEFIQDVIALVECVHISLINFIKRKILKMN